MHSSTADTVVLIPIRSFDDSKSRLAGALDAEERRRLTMWMAAQVVQAAADLPVWVVTDDRGVLEWCASRGIEALTVGLPGLNPSVTAAVDQAAGRGYERAIVAHADLPAAADLSIVNRSGVCIAPDRRRDGSNVMCVPTAAGFRFDYGPQSFERHCAEARRLDLTLTIVDDDELAWDVDDPADLPGDWLERTIEHETGST